MIAPFKFLSERASEYAKATAEKRRIAQAHLPRLFDLLVGTKSFHWKSAYFRKGQGVHVERVEAVVDAVFYDAKARKEVKLALDRLGGPGSNRFWDLYLRRIANGIIGFSEEQLSLLKLASQHLPKQGRITDWTCGSGDLAASLLLGARERTLMAIDSNPRAVIAAKRLAKHFFNDGSVSFAAKLGNPLSPQLSIPVSQGAIVQNGLFLIESDSVKHAFLKEVGANLLADGTLLLVEPKPWLQKQSVLRLWLTRIIKNAAEASSPMTEFEIALFVEFHRRLYLGAPTRFLDTKEWIELCKVSGFSVQLVREAFHGHYSVLVLKKVEIPKPPKKSPVIRYHDEPWPKGE